MRIFILFFMTLFFSASVFAQEMNTATTVALSIANRMKDSLSLTIQQTEKLFSANVWLHNQKQSLRGVITSAETLRFEIQKVENKRDSLYQEVLTLEQFEIYQTKKISLIRID